MKKFGVVERWRIVIRKRKKTVFEKKEKGVPRSVKNKKRVIWRNREFGEEKRRVGNKVRKMENRHGKLEYWSEKIKK